MKTQKTKKEVKNVLYVPPHARKKIVETDSELNTNKPRRSKLCEDSSKVFEKAAEIEERQNQMYKKAMESLEGASSTFDCVPERGDLVGDRPETCMVTAKRLVSHALGVKAVFSDADLENMMKIVSAREIRKLNQNTSGKSAQDLGST